MSKCVITNRNVGMQDSAGFCMLAQNNNSTVKHRLDFWFVILLFAFSGLM